MFYTCSGFRGYTFVLALVSVIRVFSRGFVNSLRFGQSQFPISFSAAIAEKEPRNAPCTLFQQPTSAEESQSNSISDISIPRFSRPGPSSVRSNSNGRGCPGKKSWEFLFLNMDLCFSDDKRVKKISLDKYPRSTHE